MNNAITDSAIDVAYWFFDKAEKDKISLDLRKVQHLLFLAQTHYALENNLQFFMPSLFLCKQEGFVEPNVEKVLVNGKPLMAQAEISEKASKYLEEIWGKYAKKNSADLENFIKSSPPYKENYYNGVKNVVQLKTMVENFINHSKIGHNVTTHNSESRVMFSQNGPVVVSRWQPRKMELLKQKGV